MTDLENGVTSLWLRLAADADLDTLLDGVFLDLAPVVLDATDDPADRGPRVPRPRRGRRAARRDQPRHPRRAGHGRGRGAGRRRRRPRVRRRRHGGARPRRLRRPGAGALDARRGDLPPHAHRGRCVPRRRCGPRGVPLRRDRRAVPDHRQAPRRATPLGARARAQRCLGRTRAAAARRHQPADDERLRPLGEHAPHHRRRLRRRCRGSGRGHRAAVRQPARPPRRVRPPDRPQHQLAAHLRVPRRPGRRPGRRCVRRREAHRRPRGGGLGPVRSSRRRRGPRRTGRGGRGRA